ncbi:MAG: tetratricopeptide repeat protein, partial [Wolinella sp.]
FTQEEIKDFDKQCKDGDSLICVGLGECYLLGIKGLSKDYKKAKFYLEKVCKKGNEKDELYLGACTNLGLLYHNGDYLEAAPYFAKACELGKNPFSSAQNVPKQREIWQRACNMY